jgi:GT2 family glycosyltransferase
MATGTKERWHGAIEGLEDGLLYGWCIDAQDPEARVVVDVRIDGQSLGAVTADVARTDLLAQFEKIAGKRVDACHGFVADVRLLSGDTHGVLSAAVANAAHVLEGHADCDTEQLPPGASRNFVFGDGGLRLHGWCMSGDGQTRAAAVHAYVGNREVAVASANESHPTMRHFGVEQDGFVIELPPEMADGQAHVVRVVDDAGAPLNGSPVTVCCFFEGARALLKERDAILDAVLDSYERHVPHGLGMTYYAAWQKEFEHGDAKGRAASPLRVGLVITGTPANAGKTKSSIAAQVAAKVAAFTDVRAALDSSCDVIGFIRAGDELREHAIVTALEAFTSKDTLVAYTDAEFEGRPWFKPAWNPDYAFASDYPLELMLVRREFARKYSPAAGSAEPVALAWHWLAAASVTSPDAVVHVPHALYIWNSAPTSDEKQSRMRAAAASLARIDPQCQLAPATGDDPLFAPRRIVRPLSRTDKQTPVTLIVPTRDRVDLLERCIASIRKFTRWGELEIIIVDNDSALPETHRFLRSAERSGIKVLPHPGAFNFSQMNNHAVAAAKGRVVGLINNDIEALHEDWLDEIVGQLLRPGVGAVGAKLVWPNTMVQHGGVILGVGNVAGHFGNRLADGDWGDHGRNQLAQQVSAVTAACLFVRKTDYIAVGGMDEVAFPVTFNDVDLCLKLRARGQAIVWTPFAKLLHAESASRGKEDAPPQRSRAQREVDMLRRKWGTVLLRDPAYHPSLNLDPHSHAFGGLALPPRDRHPRSGTLPR